MSTSSSLPVLLEQIGPDRRIGQQSEIVVLERPLSNGPSRVRGSYLLLYFVIKVCLLQMQSDCNRPHNLRVKLVASLEETEKCLLKSWDELLLRPLILPGLVPVSSYFHSFLCVRSFESHLCNLLGVCFLCNALAARCYIPTIGSRVLPG